MTEDASTHNSSFQAENFDSAVNGHTSKFSESVKVSLDDIPSDFEGSDLSSIHSDSESPPLKILRPSTPVRSNPAPRNTRSPFKTGKTKSNARKKSDTIYAKDIDLDNWPIEDFIHSPKASSTPNTPTKKSKPKNAQSVKASDNTTSNVNKRNRVGRTKLFRSVERGDFGQCKELVEEGADTTLRDNGGWGLIHIASGKGHLEIAKFLIEKGAPINITGLYGQTPLHDAAQINHFGLVKLLLESGAHINSRDCQGKTALDMSEDEDIIAYIKQILQQIHQNQYRDEKGQTSLHLACIQGDLDLVNKYLDEGCNINAKDNEGWTSLHRAALYGHADIVNELITRNVDVNAHGYLGDTPLHDACYNNHFDIVELLLQNGADPFLCNDNDEFPLHVATDSEVQSILKEFVDRPKVTTLRRNAKRALQFKEHSPVNHLIAAAAEQPESEIFSKQQLKENGQEEENGVDHEVETKQEMDMEVDSNFNNISMSAELTSVSDLSDIGDPETEFLEKVEVKLNDEHHDLKMESKESIDYKISNQAPPIKNQDEKDKLSPQSPKLFTPHSPPEKPPRKKRQRNTLTSKDIETLKSTLYMVSIPLADNPSTLFVVDLQVQLVLDMTLPEEGLISLYPYLYRRQVTKPEKERLWKHFRRILEPLIEISVGKVGPDQKIGKKDFLKLVMNFVKMDEIVDLIKDKYSNLSSNLITIELDLGYSESNSAEESSKRQCLKLISPTSIDLPEKPLIISPECSATESQPVKREPSSSLDFILGPSSPKRISSPKQLASPRIPSLKNILDNPDILENPYPSSTPTSPVQSPNNRMPPKLARKLKHRNSISDHGGYQHS